MAFKYLFESVNLKGKLIKVCERLTVRTNRQYSHSKVLQCLIVHLLLGFRQLRDLEYYKDDPLVKRCLGLQSLPSVATISRMLSEFDDDSIEQLHQLNCDLIIDRLRELNLSRLTLDFDGTVQSTNRHAEATAVGFNKKKKGQRSYYPLFATIAQTSQLLDFLHRSGNVHDSNGSVEFICDCVALIKRALPKAIIEIRMDSAFFSEEMIRTLDQLKVKYTISVPFERFPELKEMIESRKRWQVTKNGKDHKIGYFERTWKPKRWSKTGRFVFIRTPTKRQTKGPLQLDLFEPVDHEHKYKVIITNKAEKSGRVVCFHEGRGLQEKLFGEAKSQIGMDYIPCRKRAANEVYLLCSVLVHNLNRELQMRVEAPVRKTTKQRTPLWIFKEMKTIRHKIIQTAGKLARPQGRWTLNLTKNHALERDIRKLIPEISMI